MQTIIVTGADGTLGSAFKRKSKHWLANWRFYNRQEMPVENRDVVRRIVDAVQPDVIINCAACNDVDAEHITDGLRAANITGPLNLAKACHKDIKLVHFSTNYVYGEGENFTEDSRTLPWNPYAKSKLEGEAHILAHGGLVLRTSWIFGYPGANDLVRKIGRTGSGLFLVPPDQVANPTFAGCLVDWTKALLDSRVTGVLNAVNRQPVSRWDFASDIAKAVDGIWDEGGPAIDHGKATAPRPKVCSLSVGPLVRNVGDVASWTSYLNEALTGTRTHWSKGKLIGLEVHRDERGYSAELFRHLDVAMGYASWTKPGVTRGPHQHTFQNEWLITMSDDVEFYLWPNEALEGRWFRSSKGTGGQLHVPAGCVHAYRNISLTKDAQVLVFPDKLYRGESRLEPEDIVKWENRIDSPYELPDFSMK